MKTKRQRLADLYAEYAKDETAYFEWKSLDEEWIKTEGVPFMDNDLSRWKVVFPPKKWKAPHGHCGTFIGDSTNIYTRNNEKQISVLKEDIRKLATLSARVDELGGRRDFSRGIENYYIYYDANIEKYKKTWARLDYCINTIHMTEECAEQIAGELNSGYLELK